MVPTQANEEAFKGSIPEFYDRYLAPLIFEAYAADLTDRIATLSPRQCYRDRVWHRGRYTCTSSPSGRRRSIHGHRSQSGDAGSRIKSSTGR